MYGHQGVFGGCRTWYYTSAHYCTYARNQPAIQSAIYMLIIYLLKLSRDSHCETSLLARAVPPAPGRVAGVAWQVASPHSLP